MADYKVKGVPRRRVSPRVVIGLLIAVALAFVAYNQRENIASIVDAMRRGALVPLLAGAAFEGGRIAFHSYAYTRSFRVVGYHVPLRATVPAWFKAVFMNTVLPSGGTSGLAAVIDSARRHGVPVGSGTTATLFTQTCFYLSMLFVILVGFVVMAANGSVHVRDVLLGSVMGVASFVFVALLALGHYAPGFLQRTMRKVERLACRALAKLKVKKQPAPWADSLVHSFSTAATSISRQPRRALMVLGSMVVAMAFDMMAFVAAGAAFGITVPDALFSGYVTALVFNSFNVTPGGVGIVEGLASAALASYGYPMPVAISAVLVYRAFMYWIPFLVGGVTMYLTGAFGLGSAADKPSEAQGAGAVGAQRAPGSVADAVAAAAAKFAGEEPVYVRRRRSGLTLRERVVAFLHNQVELRTVACALAAAATGAVALGAALLPPDPAVVAAIGGFIRSDHLLSPIAMVVFAYALLLCVPGLAVHSQGNWLVALISLLGLGVSTALSARSAWALVLVIVTFALLTAWQGCFERHGYFRRIGQLARLLVYALVVVALYVAVGSLAVRGWIEPCPGAASALWMGLQSLVADPVTAGYEVDENAWRFFQSCRIVTATFSVAMTVLICGVAVRRTVEWRRPEQRAARASARAEAEAAAAERKAARRERSQTKRAEFKERLRPRRKKPAEPQQPRAYVYREREYVEDAQVYDVETTVLGEEP